MARKKKSTRKTSRRRMSGIKGGDAMGVIAIAGGAIAAKFITKALAGKMNDKVLNGVVLAGGVFLPKMIKSDFGKGLGAGMVAAGSVGLLNSFGVLNGIGASDDTYTMEFISGTDELHTISNAETDEHEETFAMAGNLGEMSVLSGVDDDQDGSVDTMSWMQGLND